MSVKLGDCIVGRIIKPIPASCRHHPQHEENIWFSSGKSRIPTLGIVLWGIGKQL